MDLGLSANSEVSPILSKLIRTRAKKRENGKPLSREKAKSWREVVAIMVVEQKMMTIITIATIVFVPA
jgi:hypothetical protein